MSERLKLEPPPEYKRFLAKFGGLNPLGDPRFSLIWDAGAISGIPIPDEFREPYLDRWFLCEWMSPEDFGPPALWGKELGPYPSRGAYVPIYMFQDNGKPIMVDSQFLNLNALAMLLSIIMKHRHDSLQKRFAELKSERDQIDAEETKRLADMLENSVPAYLGPASFRGQRNVNSVVVQKMEQVEKIIDFARNFRKRFGRGLSQISA